MILRSVADGRFFEVVGSTHSRFPSLAASDISDPLVSGLHHKTVQSLEENGIFVISWLPKLNDQSTGTRSRIVESARLLFFEQGYTATGIAQILKASGANSGSLYHFFPTKEDLLVAVLEQYKDMLGPAVLNPAFEKAVQPIERLFAVLDGYRRLLMATDFHLGCPIGNIALEMSNTHPHVRKLVFENFEGWRMAIRELIEMEIERMDENAHPDELSYLVLSTMEGAVMLSRAYHDFKPFDAAVSSLRNYFDSLIRSGTNWSQPHQLKGETRE